MEELQREILEEFVSAAAVNYAPEIVWVSNGGFRRPTYYGLSVSNGFPCEYNKEPPIRITAEIRKTCKHTQSKLRTVALTARRKTGRPGGQYKLTRAQEKELLDKARSGVPHKQLCSEYGIATSTLHLRLRAADIRRRTVLVPPTRG